MLDPKDRVVSVRIRRFPPTAQKVKISLSRTRLADHAISLKHPSSKASRNTLMVRRAGEWCVDGAQKIFFDDASSLQIFGLNPYA